MSRTIKVTGKGKLTVKPDTIRLIINMSKVESSYENAIKESADKKTELNSELNRLGFRNDALKTLNFNVNTEYEQYQDEDNSWKSRLVGYRYTHRMKLEFPADNSMLGRLLNILARCTGELEFSIHYTIADPESAKNELLTKAVEDSRIKADVLSKAAGVTLKNILSIDYSWGELEFVSRPLEGMRMLKCNVMDEGCDGAGIDIDIEADDINVTDTVTVIWEIA